MNEIRTHLYKFHDMLKQQGILFCFSGPVSQKLLNDIIKNLNKVGGEISVANKKTVKRVISVVIELIQNVVYYSADTLPAEGESSGSVGLGVLLIGHDDEYFFISCGNRIKNEKVETLREKLSTLQRMTKDDIKRLYVEQLNSLPPKGSKGAGLGFIELARKSSKPLEFDIQQIDDEMSYFSITSYIQ